MPYDTIVHAGRDCGSALLKHQTSVVSASCPEACGRDPKLLTPPDRSSVAGEWNSQLEMSMEEGRD